MAELTAEHGAAHHGGHDEAAQNENRKFGMWLYLTSEVVIFAMLIAGYIVFRATQANAVNIVKDALGILLVTGNTFVLLASSYAMVMGLRAIERGNRMGFYQWIGLTAVMGMVFLGGQYVEYSELGHLEISLEKNDFTVATTIFESVNEVEAEVSATVTDTDGNVLAVVTDMVHIREEHVGEEVIENLDDDGNVISTTTVALTGNYHVDFVDNAELFENLDIAAVTSCTDSEFLFMCIEYDGDFVLLDESGEVISESSAINDELINLNGNIRDRNVPLSRLAVETLDGDIVTFMSIVDGQAVDLDQTNYDSLNAYFSKVIGESVSLFGMRFYAPTAFHGAHVFIGVLWALLILWRGYRGHLDENPIAVEMFGLYWHFVDVVWIVLFTLIYLI